LQALGDDHAEAAVTHLLHQAYQALQERRALAGLSLDHWQTIGLTALSANHWRLDSLLEKYVGGGGAMPGNIYPVCMFQSLENNPSTTKFRLSFSALRLLRKNII
jgi:hypothetical protein